MSFKGTLKAFILSLFIALVLIGVNTVVNVNYVRADEPVTQATSVAADSTDTDVNSSTDNSIQESLIYISNNLDYMLIVQLITLGAFLGYVAIDRLR